MPHRKGGSKLTTEWTLFILRLISAGLLIAFLMLLFVGLWHDFRTAVVEAEGRRRIYGRLIGIKEIDGMTHVSGQSYPLVPVTSLGRAPTNIVPIDDHFASAEHAVVLFKSGQWWLEDQQSRNGTLLNGIPLTLPTIITDGDVIGIGSNQFRVEIEPL